jgi:hypothetical protein
MRTIVVVFQSAGPRSGAEKVSVQFKRPKEIGAPGFAISKLSKKTTKIGPRIRRLSEAKSNHWLREITLLPEVNSDLNSSA